MQSLASEHPWLYEQYCKSGYYCIRRTDRYWAGLWPDLVIEQCMMRAIHESMSKLSKHRFESSEQHRESGESRRRRDNKDIEALKEQLKEFN